MDRPSVIEHEEVEVSLTIGRVAQETGLSPKAIRLYESRGLIRAPERTEGGYRTYDEGDVAVLRFIRQARALGLDLKEVRRILDLQRSGGQPCGTVVQLLDARIRDVDESLRTLRQLRATLRRVRDSASDSQKRGDDVVVCRLIESQAPRVRPPRPGSEEARDRAAAGRRRVQAVPALPV